MARRSTSNKTDSQVRKFNAARKRSSSSSARKRKRPKKRRKQSSGEKIVQGLFNGSLWGILLVVLGIVSLLALLSAQNGSLTGWWLGQLGFLFGVGVYWMPLVFVVIGTFLYLRSNNQAPGFTLSRLAGFLLIWAAAQAAAHLLGSATDAISPASLQPGDYGGWMGWVLSQSLISVVGPSLTMAVLLILVFIGAVLLLGMSRNDLSSAISSGSRSAGHFVVSLPERWRNRQPGVIRVRPSRRARFKVWLSTLRPRRRAVAVSVRDLNGPITTLPPDTAAPPPLSPDPATPTVRIIGGEQTEWRLPRVEDILDDFGGAELSEEDLAERARTIEETLGSFGVPVTVVEVNRGPVVTQFGLRPEYITRKVRGEEKRMKVRVSKIQALSQDLSLALAAAPIRIEAPVPGRNIVGLEVPNSSVSMVSLRGIFESDEFRRMKAPLRICLGQDVSGTPVAASLARMPHLLIAGATGSGKSVCVNAIICSLLFQYTPDQMRLVMVDPKRVELTGYNGIPHLVDDVVTEIDKVVGVLQWATVEMDRRYREFEKAGARNVEIYNTQRLAAGKRTMPYLIIIIDELADIMMMSPDEVERYLVRIAQMARATGIHLVIATQRPSVNVVTGLIKANFPSRIAFAVTSQIDSRVILDTPGADRLLGRGDMLFMRPDSAKLARLQGAFVSDAEVNRLVRYWKGQGISSRAKSQAQVPDDTEPGADDAYDSAEPAVQQPLWDDMMAQNAAASQRDAMYDSAVAVVQEAGRASTSLLQRRLRIGYTRAARIIDMLEEDGVIGPDLGGSRGREVFLPEQEPQLPQPEEPDSLPWDD